MVVLRRVVMNGKVLVDHLVQRHLAHGRRRVVAPAAPFQQQNETVEQQQRPHNDAQNEVPVWCRQYTCNWHWPCHIPIQKALAKQKCQPVAPSGSVDK